MIRPVIYAPNVGVGGGLVLLRELLCANWQGARVLAILDRRGQPDIEGTIDGIDIHWVESSFLGRLRAELLLARLARSDDRVLCFHNLPPVFPVAGNLMCFVHNAYIAGVVPVSGLRGWVKYRIIAERLIARLFHRRIQEYVVQTPSVAAALAGRYGGDPTPIRVLPYVGSQVSADTTAAAAHSIEEMPAPEKGVTSLSYDTVERWDFVYPSDGSTHKNHRRLFEAWTELADANCYPSLAITLHLRRDAKLCAELSELIKNHHLKIQNLGQLPHAEALYLYRRSDALIFASYAETFGIPLLEAKAAGLPILAPELDYVRDVCEPAVTFDPFSSTSIARAVQRFWGKESEIVSPLTPQRFAEAIFS